MLCVANKPIMLDVVLLSAVALLNASMCLICCHDIQHNNTQHNNAEHASFKNKNPFYNRQIHKIANVSLSITYHGQALAYRTKPGPSFQL
jgi:hypothetical protein